MNIKEIIKEHSENAINETRRFEEAIREETKEMSTPEAAAAIIKAILDEFDDSTDMKGWIRQVFNRCGSDPTIEDVYNDKDRHMTICVDYCNGYIDLLGLSEDDYRLVKGFIGSYIKCEW